MVVGNDDGFLLLEEEGVVVEWGVVWVLVAVFWGWKRTCSVLVARDMCREWPFYLMS